MVEKNDPLFFMRDITTQLYIVHDKKKENQRKAQVEVEIGGRSLHRLATRRKTETTRPPGRRLTSLGERITRVEVIKLRYIYSRFPSSSSSSSAVKYSSSSFSSQNTISTR